MPQKNTTKSTSVKQRRLSEKKISDDFVYIDGTVIKVLPGSIFIVKLVNGREITAYIAGKLKKYYIKILYGDKVNVLITKYDLQKGRICERYKQVDSTPPFNPKNKTHVRSQPVRKAKRHTARRKK